MFSTIIVQNIFLVFLVQILCISWTRIVQKYKKVFSTIIVQSLFLLWKKNEKEKANKEGSVSNLQIESAINSVRSEKGWLNRKEWE